MDYLKRIENSVTNFEAETAKLAKIGKLIQATEKLIAEIAAEKEMLKQTLTQLENMQIQINKTCATLEQYAKDEGAARQKLVADIHQNAVEDSQAVIEKISALLENFRAQISKTCELIKKFAETNQSYQEKFLSDIELILKNYNDKNFEVYSVLSNKIDVVSETLNSRIEQNNSNFEKKHQSLNHKINIIAEEMKPLQEILSTIKYIKIAVSLALGTSVAACAINFLK